MQGLPERITDITRAAAVVTIGQLFPLAVEWPDGRPTIHLHANDGGIDRLALMFPDAPIRTSAPNRIGSFVYTRRDISLTYAGGPVDAFETSSTYTPGASEVAQVAS